MKYQKLELHISQVERLIAASRSKFHNKNKALIYANILKLFNGIKGSNYKSFNADELDYARAALDIVFYSVEFLDYKTENQIPKRLIFCLNKVINEWIDHGTDKYFIVVSYNNKSDDFHIRAMEQDIVFAADQLFKTMFGVGYSQSLIQISKPRYLFEDYLSSIPIYHEIGHFIEKNYQIAHALSREVTFPTLGISKIHFEEYFADIFAAQYIGKSAIEPLNYISYHSMTTSNPTHPSNIARQEVVNAFVDGTGTPNAMRIVNELKRVTLIRATRELKIRYKDLEEKENPFVNLCPRILKEPEKLHTLFLAGWQNWLDPLSKVRSEYSDHLECSMMINKLIRNTIKLTMQNNESRKLKKIGNYFETVATKYGLLKN